MPPAARISDMHICPMVTVLVPHVGGPILTGMPTVLIGFMPAARVSDIAICTGPPDMIAKGSATVIIGGMPAARIGDLTAHGGVIVMGCPTVMIGDVGMGGGGGGGGAGSPMRAIAVPGPTTFEDGTPDQEAVIKEANKKALDMTEAAIKRLDAAKLSPDPLVDQYFGITGTSDDDKKKLDELIGKFNKVKKGLEDGVSYEVENEEIEPGKPFTVAYVYTLPLGGGVGDVHVCFPAFTTLNENEQASTIVHELTHYHAGTDNNAYSWQTAKWNGMSQEDQMNNADSLGKFAANS